MGPNCTLNSGIKRLLGKHVFAGFFLYLKTLASTKEVLASSTKEIHKGFNKII